MLLQLGGCPRNILATCASKPLTLRSFLLSSTPHTQVNAASRIIVLDAQPLPGASQLQALLRADRQQLSLGTAAAGAVLKTARALGSSSTPAEGVMAAMALQAAALLFSVCHVVRRLGCLGGWGCEGRAAGVVLLQLILPCCHTVVRRMPVLC